MTTELADRLEQIIHGERWLPVPGWQGFYSVSDRGRVRSEPRYIQRSTSRCWVGGRILRPNWCGTVNLSRPGARRSALCTTLARETFGEAAAA